MTDPQTPDVAAARPPYLLAGLVALGALVLYVLTLAPTTQFWDASEYITAAHALGIPHPPGHPLFVILAHAWGLLPLGVDYARRINLLAAATSAAAAASGFSSESGGCGPSWRPQGGAGSSPPLVPSSAPRHSPCRSGEHTSELQSPVHLG